MHVHLRPIVFQPVPAPRPVASVAPSRVETFKVKAASGLPGDGRGGAQPPPDRRRNGQPQRDAPTRDPAAGLAMTLAMLALAGAARGMAVPLPIADRDAIDPDDERSSQADDPAAARPPAVEASHVLAIRHTIV